MRNFIRISGIVLLLTAAALLPDIYRDRDHEDLNLTELRRASQDFPYDLKASRAIALQGGWKDTLLVGDILDQHGQAMLDILVGFGVPEQSLSFTLETWRKIQGGGGNQGLADLVSGRHESLRKKTRVAHLPLFRALSSASDVTSVRDNNILFVTATGNTYVYERFAERLREHSDRDSQNLFHNWDPWNPDHAAWRPEIFYPHDLTFSKTVQNNIKDLVQGGKVIFATSAQNLRGTVDPWRAVMRCGVMLQDACFTILPAQYTSDASARLAAMAFYLAQFWDTPQEIASVLKECAVDIGVPGVDVEFGHGVATLLCPPVVEKDADIILSYSSDPAARSLRNVLHALREEPEFARFVRAMFLQ